MKISANITLGIILSLILLLMISWVIHIQVSTKFPDITDKVVLKRSLDASIVRGETIFKRENCYTCHKPDKLQTPNIRNITETRDRKWLFQFIRDEKYLLSIQDVDVINLKELHNWSNGQHDKKHLSDQEINDILNYLDSF